MNLAAHLEAARAFDDGDGAVNDLPMALAALQRLGADDARLQGFAARDRRPRRPTRPARPWPAGDAWFSRLGDGSAWPEHRDLFDEWLRHEGAGDVLRAVLPRLMLGSGGAAFHGLIRVAYAVQAAWRPELADALATWASRWLDMGASPAVTPDTSDPAEVLRAWRGTARGRPAPNRLQDLAADRRFGAMVARLAVDDRTLDRLARGGAALVAGSGHAALLPLLTSAHAVRVLLPFVDEPHAALQAYWKAWAATWAASGAAQTPGPPARLDWPEIVLRALASDDARVVMAVDSAREQERASGDGPWPAAAARALDLHGPASG